MGEMTQKERVMDYLMKHPRGITSREAEDILAIMRLSARISELRSEGANIISERLKVKNRWGKVCYISRYKLGENK